MVCWGATGGAWVGSDWDVVVGGGGAVKVGLRRWAGVSLSGVTMSARGVVSGVGVVRPPAAKMSCREGSGRKGLGGVGVLAVGQWVGGVGLLDVWSGVKVNGVGWWSWLARGVDADLTSVLAGIPCLVVE